MATLQKYKDQALAGEQELAAATERVEAAEAEAKRYGSIREMENLSFYSLRPLRHA